MLLAIDAGNTETVVGLYDLDGPEPAQRTRAEDGLVDHWRIATEANRTSDELAVLLAGFLSFRGLALDDVDGLAVSSGVPRVKESLRLLSERYLDFDPVMIEPGRAHRHRHPGREPQGGGRRPHRQRGGRLRPVRRADHRVPTSARPRPATPCRPTASTWAGPSPPASGSAWTPWWAGPPQLRAVELVEPRSVLGKSTVECIQSGAVYGFAAQVDGLCERIQGSWGSAPSCPPAAWPT